MVSASVGGRRCKASVCSRFIAATAVSNPAKVVDIRVFCLLCMLRSPQRADHSFRGFLVAARVYLKLCV